MHGIRMYVKVCGKQQWGGESYISAGTEVTWRTCFRQPCSAVTLQDELKVSKSAHTCKSANDGDYLEK